MAIFDLLRRVCTSLNENNIPYMISGSIALNIYTIPRMTRDIDIVIELNESKIEDFLKLFPDSYFNESTVIFETKNRGMFNIIDHSTGFKIDFILRKETTYFRQAFENKVLINEFNTDLWVISLEDLILAKFIWIQDLRSEKQINDLENLLLNSEKNIEYIRKWCKQLNLETYNLLENE